MRNKSSIFALLAFLALPIVSRADIAFSGVLGTEQFVIGGAPIYTPAGTFSGSYNATSGSATVSITGMPDDVLSTFDLTATDVSFSDAGGNDLDLVFNTGLSLSTSPFCDITDCSPSDPSAYSQGPFSDYYVLSSTATFTVDAPSPSATPEPSGLILLGTGVLGMAGMVRRRFV